MMKIQLLCMGKTEPLWLRQAMGQYVERLNRYRPFRVTEHQPPPRWKHLPPHRLMEAEAEVILQHMEAACISILLDENGKEMRSVDFAGFLEQLMNRGPKTMLFVSGGAWGVSEAVKQRTTHRLSLSPMTFSHQLIRLLFAEQLYRAMTILRNEPYHNE